MRSNGGGRVVGLSWVAQGRAATQGWAESFLRGCRPWGELSTPPSLPGPRETPQGGCRGQGTEACRKLSHLGETVAFLGSEWTQPAWPGCGWRLGAGAAPVPRNMTTAGLQAQSRGGGVGVASFQGSHWMASALSPPGAWAQRTSMPAIRCGSSAPELLDGRGGGTENHASRGRDVSLGRTGSHPGDPCPTPHPPSCPPVVWVAGPGVGAVRARGRRKQRGAEAPESGSALATASDLPSILCFSISPAPPRWTSQVAGELGVLRVGGIS